MDFFNFHHHHLQEKNGIYNLNFGSKPQKTKFSVGIHPKDIDKDQISSQLQWVENMITKDCFAIGECGLDSTVDTDLQTQGKVFKAHLQFAQDYKKPVIIHCVRKFYELIPYRKYTNQPLIIHGFNKRQQLAEDLLSNNFYLSFGKAVLYHLSLQKIIQTISIDRLFIETDADNFDIKTLYEKVATLKGISVETLNAQIVENLEKIQNG